MFILLLYLINNIKTPKCNKKLANIKKIKKNK